MIRRGRSEPEQVGYVPMGIREARGLGLHELVESIRGGQPPSPDGTLALHVLEAVDAIIRSSAERRVVDLP